MRAIPRQMGARVPAPDRGGKESATCEPRCDQKAHFADIKSPRDVEVAKEWIDVFLGSQSVFRSVVVDWSIYRGSFFGNPFEPEAPKKRRAYKKWLEMLLQPEFARLSDASFYLDRLLICYGYDVLSELQDRFTRGYLGQRPRIREFQAVRSWKDAHQCLQLCDLLVGCVYQKLVSSTNPAKLAVTDYLYDSLKPFGVKDRAVSYWKQYADAVMSKHFPRFSEWYWRPKK